MADSRHPEWDLMFASGIPRPKIAELCQAKRGTVFAHFKSRIDKDPSVLAVHEANRLRGLDRRPTPGEQIRLSDLAEFVARESRFPATSGEHAADELGLGFWLSKQRHLAKTNELPHAVRAALDALGRWDQSEKASRDDQRWHEQCQALLAFYRATGRWPLYKVGTPEPEHGLGVWLHMQRQKKNAGKLPADQLAELGKLLPGWRGRGY
ncbi:helicase associated domain-containing protein [Pseudarthrobacter sp. J1738]|uniref:helicase associated domain-containing protein n=1 Tax=Pseudarthrobacter sp. J1738 TaxID=3420446 RepID=UPI003D2E60E3